MDDLCKRIDKRLDELKISGAKLSRDLGFSKSFMSELRSGRAKSVTLENAVALSEYLGLSLEYLAKGEEKAPTENSGRAGLSEEDLLILDLFNSLSKEKRKMTLELISDMALASKAL